MSDLEIFFDVYFRDEYVLRRIKSSKIKTIIDIGAHVGSFSVLAGSYWPNAKYLCIEPYQRNFDLLQTNLKNSDVDAISLEAALYPSTKVSFVTNELNSGGGYLVEGNSGFPVKVVSATDILGITGTHRACILKVDVEGSEKEILLDFVKQGFAFEHLFIEFHGSVEELATANSCARRLCNKPLQWYSLGETLESPSNFVGFTVH